MLPANRVPDSFVPSGWDVRAYTPGAVVLGDSCLVAVSTKGDIGSLMRFGADDWETLYLPISYSQVLVAKRGTGTNELQLDELNLASVRLSYSHFYASHASDQIAALASEIREAEFAVSDQELNEMAAEGWAKPPA